MADARGSPLSPTYSDSHAKLLGVVGPNLRSPKYSNARGVTVGSPFAPFSCKEKPCRFFSQPLAPLFGDGQRQSKTQTRASAPLSRATVRPGLSTRRTPPPPLRSTHIAWRRACDFLASSRITSAARKLFAAAPLLCLCYARDDQRSATQRVAMRQKLLRKTQSSRPSIATEHATFRCHRTR